MATKDTIWKWVNKTDDCWQWTGRQTQWGYGTYGFRKDGKSTSTSAHRAVYQLLVDCIPEDMQLDHLCRNRLCVNPERMEIVTPQQNTLRASTALATINHHKTHCINGHEFDGSNTYRRKDRKTRECRKCRHEAVKRALNKEAITWPQ